MDLLPSDSDWDSFSESGSSEDQEEMNSLYGGKAQNIFSCLEETIGKIDDLLSFERGLMRDNIICSITDPSGQMGKVVDVQMFVDLENVHERIIRDINSRKLLRIRPISINDYVVCGPWIGKVDKVMDRVIILFDDGAKCEVIVMDQEKLLPISPNLLEDSQIPYYPGQRVKLKIGTVSKSARWLCGTWKKNQDEGIVCAVEAGLVYVNWLSSSLAGHELNFPVPARLQDSKDLTLLSCFSHENWQLGDWCICPAADQEGIMEQTFLKSSTCELKCCGEFERGKKGMDLNMNFEEIFVIAKMKTRVDVLWQDGSRSFGLDSRSLFPVNVDAHDFWPDQFVQEKATSDDPLVANGQRWGVVKHMDSKERTVKVIWKSFSLNQTNVLGGELMEQIVSAYELVEHPDYSYGLGDVVFRLEKNKFVNQPDGQVDKNQEITNMGMGDEASLESKDCGKDEKECLNECYLSNIGCVTGLKDGGVEVTWAAGHTTKVAPYEICRMEECSATTPVLHEENVEEFEEITEHDTQSLQLKEKDLLDCYGAGEECTNYNSDSSSFFFPRAAIGFFTNIAASFFASIGSTSLSVSMSFSHFSKVGNVSRISCGEEVLESHNLCTKQPTEVADLQVEDIQEIKSFPILSSSKKPELFRQFDMVSDCSDHHFVDGAGMGSTLSQMKRGWLKKVQQEWTIFEKDLPETIYVRIYEERMDLLRAAIVGANRTPYQDGLFFFDIFLPPDYPNEPPLVHYNSGGLRLNPNLYESGKVCLSLLNTWTGTGTEVWNFNSTILQVLLSLQALVLNEKPYFNEAGYERQMGRAEGEKNSVSYNENAFLITCKSMLYLLRKPPKHFETLVEEHFSRQSQNILLTCKAYMEGAPVGYASEHGKEEQENQNGNSMGFKIMLAKLLPKLMEAFADKGINCSLCIEPKN